MAELKKNALTIQCTVVGDGPEMSKSVALTEELGIKEEIQFIGKQPATRVAEILNRHKILVVPSVWNEPFGIVALEGMACGCIVVGSSGGGLPQALGNAGFVFESGSEKELARILLAIITDYDNTIKAMRPRMTEHLKTHTIQSTARKFADVFEALGAKKVGENEV